MRLDGTSLTDLQKPKDVSISQVDGLYLWENSLIAIENYFGGERIVRLNLSPDGRRILGGKLLEYRSENLELPTTGAIFRGNFYYFVNTQIDHEKDGVLSGEEELKPIKIGKLPIE